MSKVKRIKFFNIFQFDLEEKFLNEMHRKGYAFTRISGLNMYNFEPTSPQTVTYKLEYKSEVDDQDAYIQLMRDYGWEYVGTYFQYFYFRQVGKQDVIPFYTNKESKLNHLNRILLGRFVPILLFSIILFFMDLSYDPDSFTINYLSMATQGIVSFILALYVILFATLGYHYFRLRKIILEEDDRDD